VVEALEQRTAWAEVAERTGKTMHAHAEFELLAGPLDDYEPWEGQLPRDLVLALAEVLARHTGSPERCWFCVWDGGWISGPGAIGVALGTPADTRAEAQREWAVAAASAAAGT
jgi:hypothetical protein